MERVSKVLPQAQVTTHRRYEGWIPAFIFPILSTKRNLTNYQARRAGTITLSLLACLLCALRAGAQPVLTVSALPGFAPPEQNLLAPLLRLAPDQPAQAVAIFDHIHDLDRKLSLHPVLSPQLQAVIDSLPASELVPLQMPLLYASDAVPWQSAPPNTRYVAFQGHPSGTDYIYSLADHPDPPAEPGDLQGALRVMPVGHPPTPHSVTAELKVSLYLSAMLVPSRAGEAAAGFEQEIHGTLTAPWDVGPGVFNQHDEAALARLRRDLPATAERLEYYVAIHNLLDEFSDASGPWVLFNLDAAVKQASLARFPHLQAFWREIADHVEAHSVVRDARGRRWLSAALHRGRLTVTFMLRRGMLTPMDSDLRPAGCPVAIEQIQSGRFYTDTTVSVQHFGMRFGLKAVRFVTTYEKRGGAIRFAGHMTDVPQLIAPRIIHPLTMLLAGEFLNSIARGNGGRGLAQSFSALPGPRGGTMLSTSLSAELSNAPALALVVRMATAFAPSYGAQVREEQRRLLAEFFNAFDSDYQRARPALLGAAAPGGP